MTRHHHRIAPLLALTAALSLAAPAYATPPPGPGATATNAGSPSRTSACARNCVEAVGQAPAAELGFNRSSAGQAPAAELGFDRSPVGQAPATQLGFNRGPVGQAPAAQLGFNPRSVNQAPRPRVASGGGYTSRTKPTTELPVARAKGFDWGDAGIGAGGALGLTVLLLGGALVITNARQRPRHNATQPTA